MDGRSEGLIPLAATVPVPPPPPPPPPLAIAEEAPPAGSAGDVSLLAAGEDAGEEEEALSLRKMRAFGSPGGALVPVAVSESTPKLFVTQYKKPSN